MNRRLVALAAIGALCCSVWVADAQSAMPAMPTGAMPVKASPTPAPSPNAAEAAFLKKVMTDLPKRYGTTAAATAAGYVRYSNEDRTGAISWVNTKYWDTTDPSHPAQLWYDAQGRLIGADFSVPQAESSTGKPTRFGIDASRWDTIGAHVHYVEKGPGGTLLYGKAVGAKKYGAANNGSTSPTAEGLVATGAVKDASQVAFVFLYPAIYDVSVWVIPNPLGQFADKNPNVKPSASAGKGEDSM